MGAADSGTVMLEDAGEGLGDVVGAHPLSRAQVRVLSVVSICSCFMAFKGSCLGWMRCC